MSTLEILSEPRPVSMSDGWFDLAAADHFWMEWRFEALRQLAGHLPDKRGRILEVGCGHGVFRQQLEDQLGYTVDGCDLNTIALEMAGPGRGKLLVYDIHDRDADLVGTYAGVFLMDVLEHIDDDTAFLRSAAAHARPGGIVAINVPALESLSSRYDKEVGHVRRYDRASLTDLLGRAGLTPVVMNYWGFSLLPVLVLRKLMLSLSRSPSIVARGFQPPGVVAHALFKALKSVELRIVRTAPLGTSLMAIARVPG